MGQSEYRFTNHRKDVVIVIVAHVKGQIPVNALQETGANQTSRATGANATLDCVFREMLDDMTGPAAANLSFLIVSSLP